MDVRCERCKTEYELDDARVTEAGIPVKCATCGYVFRVKKKALIVTVPMGPNDSAEGATTLTQSPERAAERVMEKPREWRIRQGNGAVATLRELTTLQRWIVEQKVVRGDEISVTGESWKRLGDIPELHPFFDVLDRALSAQAAPAPQAFPRTATPAPSPITFDDAPEDLVETPASPEPTGRTTSGEQPAAPAFPRGAEGLQPLDAEALSGVGLRPGPRRTGSAERSARSPLEDEDDGGDTDFTQGGRRTGLLVVGGVLVGVAAFVLFVVRPDFLGKMRGGETGPSTQRVAEPRPRGRIISRTAADPDPAAQTPPVAAVPSAISASPEVADGGAAPPGNAPLPTATAATAPTPPEASTPPPARRTAAFRDYDGHIAQGDRLRERDRARGALEAYEKAIELSPERAEGYAGRGLALLDLGKREQAEAAFLQALRFNPRYGVAIMGLAETYRVQNRKEEALKHYQRYLEVAPTGMEAAAARAAIQKLGN